MEQLAKALQHAIMAEHFTSLLLELEGQLDGQLDEDEEEVMVGGNVSQVGTGRRLMQSAGGAGADVKARLQTEVSQQRRPGCPTPSSLARECMSSWTPHLTVLGVAGMRGAGVAGVGGFEAVFDSQTFEIGFFSYVGLVGTLPQVSITLYAGGGFKGRQRAAGLSAAYSGYFLCAGFGGNVFLGVSVTGCVSGSSPVTPLWADAKTVVAGFGASVIPYPFEATIGVTYYTALNVIRCERPSCVGAIMAFTPGNPISRTRLFIYYMDRFCAPGQRGASTTECTLYRTTRDFVRNLVTGAGVALSELGAAIRGGPAALRRFGSRALEASRRAVVQGVRQVLGSPELQAPVYFDIPRGRGTYMKLKDCTDMRITEPYFRCRGSGSASSLSKNTQVGLKNPSRQGGSPNYWWVYNSDVRRAGYGLFFPNSGNCVSCTMMDRRTLWSDSTVGYTYSVCSGPLDYQRVTVRDSAGRSKGTCNVLYKHNA